MQYLAEITPFAIEEIRSGTFQRNLSPEHTLHKVVFYLMVIGTGHVNVTMRANSLFTFYKRSSTNHTTTWEKEMKQRA
jgi:hypothetical protein